MGPFEKSIVGLLAVLFGIYFCLDHFFPAALYPELNKIRSDQSFEMSPAPRRGEVIPANNGALYLANPSLFLSEDDLAAPSGPAQYDPTQINVFAKGSDGDVHPSNAYFLGFVPFNTTKDWLPLMAVSLRVGYMRDNDSKTDTWQTSLETYTKMWGDCEDYSILLADWLTGLGYDAKVVAGTVDGEGHAWVVLFKDGKEYLLEATEKGSKRSYPLVSLHPEYVPAYMFNDKSFWVVVTDNNVGRNQAPKRSWVELSRFKAKNF